MLVTLLSFALLSVAAAAAYPLLRGLGAKGFYALAAAPAASFLLFLWLLPQTATNSAVQWEVPWIAQFNISFSVYIDLFSNLLAMLVTLAGALILMYCASYFRQDDENVPRFGMIFLAFATAMLGLVISDNVFVMFLFWEATTVLSFLLIGHNGKKRTSRAAAQQAIIVTTLGGLAMLIGLLLLTTHTGEANLSAILVSSNLHGPLINVACYLLLAGALSKSAIFPFHFWLPQAMAAPTPVSAYLHAAAMVKAGIYLIAKMGPAFAEVPGYRLTLVALGAVTMLIAAVKALRQYDLKLILAHGTVSQLGMLTMLYGVGQPTTDAAATALLFAHAVAKAPLFLTVGMIEHRAGTRDLRLISGLGRQDPPLAIIATTAGLSMLGMLPLVGFVAKEAALTELLRLPQTGVNLGALGVLIIGSILTAAYTARFLLGAFKTKRDESKCVATNLSPRTASMLFAPSIFALLALVGGVLSAQLDPLYQMARPQLAGSEPEHLALWHGFTPALGITAGILAMSMLTLWLAGVTESRIRELDERYTFSTFYSNAMRALNFVAVQVTSVTQRGSLPYYLSLIFLVVISGVGGMLLWQQAPLGEVAWGTPLQLIIAIVLIVSAIATIFAAKRFQAVILVGFTGFAMATLYGLHGAPDLALTQMLVEAITLIAFVLVIRRLPQHLARRSTTATRIRNLLIGTAMALVIGVVTVVAMGARIANPVSLAFPEMAVTGGHGYNVVNVTLVDIRGWDTFGELSVVVVAATGIASLVFLSARGDNLPKLRRKEAKQDVLRHLRRLADPNDPATRNYWMIAGRDLSPERRSIIFEVVVRLMFHAMLVLSLYMLLAGHNSPGGGFAGGLIAGMALVSRYLVGGRTELGATVPFDAGKIVGAGMALAAITAILPLFFNAPVLFSSWVDLELGFFGELPLVTSTLFDVGVYLVVFGLVLDVLRSLGSQIDVHSEEERQVAV